MGLLPRLEDGDLPPLGVRRLLAPPLSERCELEERLLVWPPPLLGRFVSGGERGGEASEEAGLAAAASAMWCAVRRRGARGVALALGWRRHTRLFFEGSEGEASPASKF